MGNVNNLYKNAPARADFVFCAVGNIIIVIPVPQTNHLILDYSPRPVAKEATLLINMRRWHSICGWCFWLTIPALFYYYPLGLGASAATLVAAVFTLIYMGRVAAEEAGTGYAGRQVVLAILLSPLCLLGVWLVPLLVESDLQKWRTIEEHNSA